MGSEDVFFAFIDKPLGSDVISHHAIFGSNRNDAIPYNSYLIGRFDKRGLDVSVIPTSEFGDTRIILYTLKHSSKAILCNTLAWTTIAPHLHLGGPRSIVTNLSTENVATTDNKFHISST
jgi:hypothetical protein